MNDNLQNLFSASDTAGKGLADAVPGVSCPAIVIAGTQSGVGKTSVSLGLVRHFRLRGIRVRTFKVGPDYLDPTWLALASGRPCYNLDTWMMGRRYVRELFSRKTRNADLAVIEGVMGMYDGCRAETSESSTADVAACLKASVVLVCDVHGVARSLAATVKGFAELEAAPGVAGVIANRCGSARHRELLALALANSDLPPLAGAVPRNEFPNLPSRHLGLVAADHEGEIMRTIDKLAEVSEKSIDSDMLLALARSSVSPSAEDSVSSPLSKERLRIAVARDRAFQFYYQDNLEALEGRGCELRYFSPLQDSALPDDVHALYLGGGYPEEHADALAGNRTMLDSVRQFCQSGRPVYAECGGLMYLSRGIEKQNGKQCFMAGVIPVFTRMLNRLKALGYAEIRLNYDSLWGAAGKSLRGHEFHYSEVISEPPPESGWKEAYTVSSPRRGEMGGTGFLKGNMLASYIHLHFASSPEAVEFFINQFKESI